MTTVTRNCCACLQPMNVTQPNQVVHPKCANASGGTVVVFADVTITEDFTAYGERTGKADHYPAGCTIEPLQLAVGTKPADILSPDAVWTSEAQTGVCGDWTYLPGRVLSVDVDSIRAYKA